MTPRHALIPAPLAAALFFAAPLAAEPGRIAASTRLGRCGDQTCLIVTGHRSDTSAPVLIAGHDVPVEGARRWRAVIPLRTVRDWAAPSARRISVEVAGWDGGQADASLPIGLLGHVTRLAFLDVSSHR